MVPTHRIWMALLTLGVGLGLWWVQAGRRDRRFDSALAEAETALREGRHATARRSLRTLLERRPRDDKALYLLGLAEHTLGRDRDAESAWGRIPDDAPHRGWAFLHWADIDTADGRLRRAEERLRAAIDMAGEHRPYARWSLVQLLRRQGRLDEARGIFRDGYAEHPEPAEALKVLYKLDVEPFPVEAARQFFAEALKRAPDDDRVWLGLASLATRGGRYDEARSWLDRCLANHPRDPAAWRAQLEWAVSAGRPDMAAHALPFIPAGPDGRAEALWLRAWFAGQAGDPDAERQALEALDRNDPSRPDVIDRLAAIAAEAGRRDLAARYRARRTELERHRERYVELLRSQDPRAHADELARLAEALGRRFDASCWADLARRPGEGPDVRVAGARLLESSPTKAGASLAVLLRDLADWSAPGRDVPSDGGATLIMPRFVDDAAAVGLDFVHDNGQRPGRLVLPETGAGGVALLDYDGDGWLDVYAVQGGPFPPVEGPNADRLFRNRGDGTFEDASDVSGIAGMAGGYGHGVTVGDYDGDGHPDLFVTRWRSYSLYRNRGDGTFEDATEAAALGGDRDWPTSAAFADLDGDGDLDLYICHYLRWDEHGDRTCVDPNDPAVYSCNPLDFPSCPDRLFRNEGGRFVEATEEAGIVDNDGRGLGVIAADLDGDGLVDLFVANDMTADLLFLNRGGLHFEEMGVTAGVAANASGRYQAGMGTACGDLDGDGLIDLAVTNFYNESTTFFRNLGGGFFADQTAAMGLAAPSRDLLGFGLAMLDANNDGRLDLLSANGHVHDGRPEYPWMMPAQLLMGTPDGRLVEAGSRAGSPFDRLHLGRGLAVGDLDNDGRIDAVLQAQNEPLVYLHNRTESPANSATFLLEGTTSNRDGIGAVVTVEAGGRRRVVTRFGGGSYQSASDPRLHVGVGRAATIDRVEVRWPSGRTDTHRDLATGTGYRLREGASHPLPLEGFGAADGPSAQPVNLAPGRRGVGLVARVACSWDGEPDAPGQDG